MRRWALALVLGLWWLALAAPAWAAGDCVPRIERIQAAPELSAGPAGEGVRPTHAWVPVTLPDDWARRWPAQTAVWYRIDWQLPCADEPVGLGIDGFSMAGAVYAGETLLWRDAALAEPLSRSWNRPRWWLLPRTELRPGANTLWVRVVGEPTLSPGLGPLRIGPAGEVQALQARHERLQRTVFFVAMGASGAVGALFFVVWLLRRQERAYGWFALMSLAWALYLATILASTPWPFAGAGATLALSRANIALFVLYVLGFCQFTFRFGGQSLPRLERALLLGAALGVAAVLLAPHALVAPAMQLIWLGFAGVLFANCVQFQWHAWRPRAAPPEPAHRLLALCWLLFLVIGAHDLWVVLRQWEAHAVWGSVTGPLMVLLMALLVGGRLAAGMRRIERFNDELAASVAGARAELTEALAREHAQALRHTKLQERLRIAHDLHDGLGGALVRGMALVEQSPEPLPSARVLSLLKLMRDDLRQVVDYGSSAGASVPDTPVQWLAPLRHRFTGILDELGVACQWHIEPAWLEGVRPSALQCLALQRVVEEALANAIKHSRARSVRVDCTQPEPERLLLRIADDGVGFDVAAVQRAGLSVGMRSMAARAERLGAQLRVESGPGGTVVSVDVTLRREADGAPAHSDWAALPALD